MEVDTTTGGRSHEIDSEHHRFLWSQLPWVLNGTAEPAVRAEVEQHLRHCECCRMEMAALEQVQAAIYDASPAVEPDVQQGLRKLLWRLDTPAQERSVPARPRSKRKQWLVCALLAAIVAQAIGLLLLILTHLKGNVAPARYGTLSETVDAPAPARGLLLVVPSPQLTLTQWQALLREHGMRIVDGPNAAGAYRLAPAAGGSEAAARAIPLLRGTPGIVLVESVDGAP